MTRREHKWQWMMDWCKNKGLPCANNEIWKMAESEYHKIPLYKIWAPKPK
jgi:hypothetical protein